MSSQSLGLSPARSTAGYYPPQQPQQPGAGILRQRHQFCTDQPACCVFALALGAFAAACAWALREGDVGRLRGTYDHRGHICGVDAGVEDKPFLYWCVNASVWESKSLVEFWRGTVCVASCPGANASGTVPPDCGEDPAAQASYDTVLASWRYCVPDPAEYPAQSMELQELSLGSTRSKVLRFMAPLQHWNKTPMIFCQFGIAVLMGYSYLALLRCCADRIVQFELTLSITGWCVMAVLFWKHAVDLERVGSEYYLMPAIRTNSFFLKVSASVCAVLCALTSCVAAWLRSSVRVAAKCASVAAEATCDMPVLLLAITLNAAFCITTLVLLTYGALALYTTGTIDGPASISHSAVGELLLAFYMAMFLWLLLFVTTLWRFVLAYVFTEYYETPYGDDGKKHVGGCLLLEGFMVGLRYHAGSIAFGSVLRFLLRACQSLVVFTEARKREGSNNVVVKCIVYCVSCCCCCCGASVGSVSSNAWIQAAVAAEGFCDSARNADHAIEHMGVRLREMNGATSLLEGCAAPRLHGGRADLPLVDDRVRHPQTSGVSKKSRQRFFIVFGLSGPSPGLGTVKKRLGMKNRSQGSGREVGGPRLEKIETSDVWVPRPELAHRTTWRGGSDDCDHD
ncbi:unnamed protein product [Prorocentrum cordatum]|uniref:Choline transporter-like protein n=1 Tax=Prorocentrum cordatum TaxID=2364126 RepID=A0ABN9V881_9DINO|nr:unnamed protein product [Polarella glacialis]